MKNDRQASRLLLAILGERWDEADAILRLSPPDPERFVDLAQACDVHPAVHAILEDSGRLDAVLDESASRRLSELRRKCRVDNLLLLARLERVLDLLLAAGIVPVALKGVDVLHRLPVEYDRRTLDDADLLVRPDEFHRAVKVLEDAGWKGPEEPERTRWMRTSFQLPLRSPGPVGVSFEIHWDLGQERRYRIDMDGVFSRTVPLKIAGRTVARLDDHDVVAHLLLHHLQHYFDRRLKWGLDLGMIVRQPGFDWGTVEARLRQWGGLAAAAMCLRHLHKLFPETVPRQVLARFPVALWRRALTCPLRSSHPLDLFRGTRRRRVQLWLAGAFLESPASLPAYLLHRATRESRAEEEPRGTVE